MIRNVIFDFDDTLTRTHNGEFERHNAIARKLGLRPVSEKRFRETWGPPWSVEIALLYPGCDVRAFQEAYAQRFLNRKLRLIGGARATLAYLAGAGYQAFLLTSRDRRSLEVQLLHHGIEDHFDQIHTADHAPFHKPDPRVFLSFMTTHGLIAEESLYVGDLLTDYEGARKAGLAFVAVLTGPHVRSRFLRAGLKPKYIIPSVKHLPKWLRTHNR